MSTRPDPTIKDESRLAEAGRVLADWFEVDASAHEPVDLLSATLQRTARTRRRAAWRIPERWIPMPITLRLAVVPRAAMLLLLLALLVALTAGSIVVGSRLNLFATVALPAPIGPAGNGLIAYHSAGDIWVVDPDSAGDPRQLTSGPAVDLRPRWSPDGTRLAYWSSPSASDHLSSLIVVKADGTSPMTVASGMEGAPEDMNLVDWSPDGTRVAYHCCGDDDRIFVAAADGSSGAVEVGDPTLPAGSPDWSPDSSLIAFAGGTPAERGVYVMSHDGIGVHPLTLAEDVRRLEWSPDGTRIAYIAGDTINGPTHLRVVKADGTDDHVVAGTPSGSLAPSWSPDGDRIAFWAETGRLSVIPAEGGEQTLLIDYIDDYAWSPDGTAIVGKLATGIGTIDAATGEPLWELPLSAEFLDPTWQRVAPATAHSSGKWVATGSMTDYRSAHTATLLTDGRVLVAGGALARDTDQARTTTSSSELYDPATGTWTAAGDMTIARGGHSATLLADGRVLVSGGSGTSAEIYDPATGSWTATGPMVEVHGRGHTATLLPDGRILVVGGEGAKRGSAELYDPTTGSWRATGEMIAGRWYHAATLLRDGRVLVAGSVEPTMNSAELYDPVTETWRATGSMGHARWDFTATLLSDGTVLVGPNEGTSSAELYDPGTDTWSPTGSAATSRHAHTATLLADGTVLVTGGRGASAELYDPGTGTWSAAPDIARPYTATLLPDGTVLVTGEGASAKLYIPGRTA